MPPGAISTLYVDFRAGLASLDTDMQAISRTLSKSGRDFEKLGKSLSVAFTAPIIAAGKKIFDASDSYQKAARAIQVQTGATGAQLQALKGDFEAVAGSVPNSFGETAKAISQVAVRTGETGKSTQDLAKNFLQLSNITETDLNANLRGGLQLFDTWGVTTADQIPTLNKLFRATQLSGGSISDLITNVSGADAVLGTLGYSLDESIALFTSFERGGVDAGGAIASLSKGLKVFAEKGVADPKKAMDELLLAIEKTPESVVLAQTAYKVFGKSGLDIIDAAKEGRFHYQQYLDTIQNGKSTIGQTADATKSFGETITEAFNKANIEIAKSLGPDAFKSLGDAIALLGRIAVQVIQVFTQLPIPVQAFTIALLASLASLGPLVFVMGQVANAGSVLSRWMSGLSLSFGAVAPAAATASTELVAMSGTAQMSAIAMGGAATTTATQWTLLGSVMTGIATTIGVAVGALFVGALLTGEDFSLFLKGFVEFLQGVFPKAWDAACSAAAFLWETFVAGFHANNQFVADAFTYLLETFGLGPEQIKAITTSMLAIWERFTKAFDNQIKVITDGLNKMGDGFRVGIFKLGQFANAPSWMKWAAQEQKLAEAKRVSNAEYEKQKKILEESNTAGNELAKSLAKVKPPAAPGKGTPGSLPDYLTDTKKAAEEAAKAIEDIAKRLIDSKAAAEIDKIKDKIDTMIAGNSNLDLKGQGSNANLTVDLEKLGQKLRDKAYADEKSNLDKLSGQKLIDAKKVIDQSVDYELQKYKQELAPKILEIDKKNHETTVSFFQGLMEDAITGTRFDWEAQFKKAAAEIAAEWLTNMVEANLLASTSFSDFFGKVSDSLVKGITSWFGNSGIGDLVGTISGTASGASQATSLLGNLFGPTADAATYAGSLEAATEATKAATQATTLATKASTMLTAALPWAGVAAIGAGIAYNNYDKFSNWNSNTTNEEKGTNVVTAGIDSVFPGMGTLIDQMLNAVGISFGSALTKNQQSLKGFEKFVEEALKKSLGVALNFAVGDINQFDRDGWADKFWEDFGAVGGETFSTLGTAFEKLLGLQEGVGGQIGALLAENLAGATTEESLNNIALFLDAVGVSAEELTTSLLEMANAGNITWFEFESMRQSLEKIPTEGLAGIGDVVGALEQVTAAGGRGKNALTGLRNIAIEAGEAGVTSLEGLQQYLLDAGASAELVNALFTALGQRGIASLEDLKNAADPALGGVIADMQTLGVQWEDFTAATETLETGVKNLADAIRELSNSLKDVPKSIDTEVNVSTNEADRITANKFGAVMRFAKGGIVRAPTLFPTSDGGLGLMGEAGTEGILPLANIGGKLGVHATGMGGGGSTINVYVDATGAKAGVEHSILAAMQTLSRDAVADAVQAMAESNRRGSY